MSTTSPSSHRSDAGSGRPLLVLLLPVVTFAAGLFSPLWYIHQHRPPAPRTPAPDFGPLTPSAAPATPETVATAPPATEAAPSPAAEAPPAPAAAAPGAVSGARPAGRPRGAKP